VLLPLVLLLVAPLLVLVLVPTPRLSPVPPHATNVSAIMVIMAIREPHDISILFRDIGRH
jgi:hypothetical protein